MMRKVTAIITALVIGVACFSVTVYAWFQASITNTGNKIESAEYGIKVSITTNGTNVSPYRPAGSGPVWRNQTGPDHRAG